MNDRAISLNAVIDALDQSINLLEAGDRIRDLPPVKPQEPTGHWILSIEDWNKWTCSECGYSERTDIHVSLGYDYCPKCGARMVEPQESEE